MTYDNYFLIAYKILKYLQSCLLNSKNISLDVLHHATYGVDSSYFQYVIKHMLKEGLIENVYLIEVDGVGEMMQGLNNIQITPKGMEYLSENTMMKKVTRFIKDMKESIPGL